MGKYVFIKEILSLNTLLLSRTFLCVSPCFGSLRGHGRTQGWLHSVNVEEWRMAHSMFSNLLAINETAQRSKHAVAQKKMILVREYAGKSQLKSVFFRNSFILQNILYFPAITSFFFTVCIYPKPRSWCDNEENQNK